MSIDIGRVNLAMRRSSKVWGKLSGCPPSLSIGPIEGVGP